jgi:ATP-dependent DNA ligase
MAVPPTLSLARAVKTLPGETGMPGGSRYEPKWDGFRAAVVADGGVRLWSRHGTDLSAAFPEIVEAANIVPDGTVVDGELVAWVDGRLDFDALQQRSSAGSRRSAQLARALPASYVAFDLLAVLGRDVRHHPFDVRRELLEELTADWSAPLQLSPLTRDRSVAQEWSESMAAVGVEGIVAKGGGQTYEPGERAWVKIKRRESIDVVVAAVIGPMELPEALVIGTPSEGRLRIVGRTASLKRKTARSVGALLRHPAAPHPWPEFVSPGAIDRFNGGGDQVRLTLVEPIVGEVSADMARSNGAFRHSARLVRLRPELDPATVPPLR